MTGTDQSPQASRFFPLCCGLRLRGNNALCHGSIMQRIARWTAAITNRIERLYSSHPGNFIIIGAIVSTVVAGVILALMQIPSPGTYSTDLTLNAGEQLASRHVTTEKRASKTAGDITPALKPPTVSGSNPKQLIRVYSPDPYAFPCRPNGGSNCFRLRISIQPTAPGDFAISHIWGSPIEGTHAIMGDGTACKAYPVVGISTTDAEGQLLIPTELVTTASSDRHLDGVIEFVCDGPVAAGDEAILKMTLYVAQENERAMRATWTLDKLRIKAKRPTS